MNKLNVFVDSDVVISSLLSSHGASYLLLNSTEFEPAKFFISDFSILELREVVTRRQIKQKQLNSLVKKRLTIKKLHQAEDIFRRYNFYVFDPDDAHIVAGARQSKSRFLVSFNLKDYKADRLKKDLNIILTTPAHLLQYLRSV